MTGILFEEWLQWFFARLQADLLDPTSLRNYAKLGVVLFITLLLEIASRKNWRMRYGSRNFRVDILYFVFYYGGVYHILFFAWIYRGLLHTTGRYAPFLQLNLLSSLSPLLQFLLIILAADFIGYWSHRWRHSTRYLWAFHSIHHSQKVMTVVTNYRFHFVDETLLRLWLFIPYQILGTRIEIWLTADFIMAWIFLVQHTEWNWNYGPLGRVFVSPHFHRLHHSTDPVTQNKNFGMLFSFWDDLFGSAERSAPCPEKHGIAGDPVPETFLGQLAYPFVEIVRLVRARSVPPIQPTAGRAAE
jgi:sterol desaturase/sphingolipid hydroxylase (fatty acid hydroxylase superfamily)